jgi:hypothetical protein
VSEAEVLLALRVIVLNPVSGVTLMVQGRDKTLLGPAGGGLRSVWFDFVVRLNPRVTTPDFLGLFVHGPRGGRFVYVNVGTMAGQAGSPWSRRAKVPLGGITAELVRAATEKPGLLLAAAISGTGTDGTPACATVPLSSAWRVVRRERHGQGKRA